jgi:uncharacterized membrane protein YphA (DoxX/SURF4 family)
MESLEYIAWLLLRVVYAWMFLYPIKGLLSDWQASIDMVKLIMPWQTSIVAYAMIVIMFLGALSILFGIYAKIAGFFLLIYCLIGARLHYLLAYNAKAMRLSELASEDDRATFSQLGNFAVVGHVTSAQKNFVLASVAAFFMIMGSGPWSLVS